MRQAAALMARSHVCPEAMDDFAIGSDIGEVIDQTVIRLTPAGKT